MRHRSALNTVNTYMPRSNAARYTIRKMWEKIGFRLKRTNVEIIKLKLYKSITISATTKLWIYTENLFLIRKQINHKTTAFAINPKMQIGSKMVNIV